MNIKRKLSSRKFWAGLTGVIISVLAFTKATPDTVERVTALISAISVLAVYMLSEAITDIDKRP